MEIEYIIVQAGGRGARLGYLTNNRPKALVPVDNCPMLFHLFRQFETKKFIIIADYKKEVLREYLHCFSKVRYRVVDADGKGTCGGIQKALELIPGGCAFLLIWSDLLLPEHFALPEKEDNYIGISQTFPCRWSWQSGRLEEKSSKEHGVAGMFLFREKEVLKDVPGEGEFVRCLREKDIPFQEIGMAGTREFGLLSEYEALEQNRCRPFNKITFDKEVLIKEAVNSQGEKLAVWEKNWYIRASQLGVTSMPKIYGFHPLKQERIQGKNVYEYDLTWEQKRETLKNITAALKKLHALAQAPADSFSLQEAYFNKTIKRLEQIRDLVPFGDKKRIRVNGRECRNIFFYKRELEKKLENLEKHCGSFSFIHGDCTFSNIMLREGAGPVLIDPRGYFGYTEYYGDERYDWAKLYYSIVGNYDKFNLKKFGLDIRAEEVRLLIESNHWEELEEDFFAFTGADREEIKLLHAIIWLSLTTYAWQDYDSVCGAFYNGIYYLEEVL